jgi:hypothetical protein
MISMHVEKEIDSTHSSCNKCIELYGFEEGVSQRHSTVSKRCFQVISV